MVHTLCTCQTARLWRSGRIVDLVLGVLHDQGAIQTVSQHVAIRRTGAVVNVDGVSIGFLVVRIRFLFCWVESTNGA